MGTVNHLYSGDTAQPKQWLAEGYRIAQEQALRPMIEVEHPYHQGFLLIVEGKMEEGLAGMLPATQAWHEIHWLHPIPQANTQLATALGRMGRIAEARALIAEALRLIHSSGQRMHEAEAYRIDGELLLLGTPADADEAESTFQKAMEIARAQSAKSWELRAATSLARLWQAQGKHKDALALLQPVYAWFTEGFDIRDLREAKALLTM